MFNVFKHMDRAYIFHIFIENLQAHVVPPWTVHIYFPIESVARPVKIAVQRWFLFVEAWSEKVREL